MKKTFLLKTMFLLCALVTWGNAWADDYSLTPNQSSTGSSATSYITTLTEFTHNGIKWKMNQWNPKTLQVKTNQSSPSGEFRFYNSSAFPGKITKVVVKFSALSLSSTSNTGFMFLGGASEVTSTTGGTAGTWNPTNKTITWEPNESDNFTYFAFYQNGKVATGTNNLASSDAIVVTYSTAAPTKVATPTISGDETFLTSTDVTIACGTDGAAIQYSTDNGTSWNNYSAPFTLTETTTVKAKATKSGLTDSDEASKTFTKLTPMTVAEAIAAIDAASGTTGVYVVGIVCEGGSSLGGGSMNYWISDDGTETNKFEIYRGKGLNGNNFTSTDDVKVGDIVVVYGNIKKYNATYEFDSGSQIVSLISKVIAPTFSPVAGAVAAGTNVAISTATEGATIYYTIDGTEPTTSSSIYSAPITIDAAKTIKAFAVKDGYPNSDVATASYTIALPVATPAFSLAEGIYTSVQSVTISTTTDGATIYYTTDGTEPTTGSSVYSSEISVGETMTIKAIAAKEGMITSSVASATYTINLPDYALLPFSFDGGRNDIATTVGLTQDGLDSDYGSSPKLKFNSAGDIVILKINEVPGKLTFDVKGNGFSGGTFKVQASADGSNYSDLGEYTELGATQNESFVLADNVRYIKWNYVAKSNGNVALGNITLSKGEPIPVSAAGWATYCSSNALDFTGVTELTAYTATKVSDAVKFNKVTGKVPANTGLLVSGTTANVPVAASADAVTNILEGVTAETVKTAGTVFVLKQGVNGLGFYKNTNDFTVRANSAYLPATAVSGARAFIALDDEATGIENLTPALSKGEGVVNDLSGRRVVTPAKGLYIVNGKKVVVK